MPVRISQRIAPRAKTSARRSSMATSPLACSGGMYAGVPRIDPASVSVPKLPCEPVLRAVRMVVTLRDAGERRAGPFLVGDAPFGQDLGQPPVHHLDLAEGPHHDVGRLEVAVDHPLGVGIRHRLRHLQGDGQQAGPIGRRVGPFAEDRRERLALDQLHGEEGPVAEAADVVDRHDAGMLQLAADLRLLDEALGHVGAVGVPLQEHLDREVAAEVDVPAPQHGPHAAAGDLAGELVAVADIGPRGHGVGLRLDGEPAFTLGVLEENGLFQPQAGMQRAKRGSEANIERVERERPGLVRIEVAGDGFVGVVRLVHGIELRNP